MQSVPRVESVLISARKCFIQIGKSPEEKYEQKPQKRKKERTKVVRQQVYPLQKLRKKPEIETCPFRFSGELCIRNFLEWLHTLTEDDTRQVRVLAHNFQGYDSYFILEEYHR